MYGTLAGLDMGLLALLAIFGWVGGTKAFRLAYTGSAGQLARRSRKLISWAVYSALAAAGSTAVTLAIAATKPPIFWVDRLALHVPLAVVPLAAIWFAAVPRIRQLRRRARAHDGSLSHDIRTEAAAPGLMIPFHATALGGVTGFYFAMVPPVPARIADIALPLLLYGAALAALYVRNVRRWHKMSEAASSAVPPMWRRTIRFAAVVASVGAIGAVGIYMSMQNSKLPSSLSMMSGPMEWGGGAVPAAANGHNAREHQGHPATTGLVSVDTLTGPQDGKPDRSFTLVAERKDVKLASGETVKDAWTFNGQLPGPELRMKKGELIEVKLVNRNIEDGVTVHWHGLDVPNAEDGVAGVTQDAVMPGEEHTYRFIAEQTGTFWYHSHQHSREAVWRGLFGSLIVEDEASDADIVVMSHIWEDVGFSVGDATGIQRRTIEPGTEVRLRLINTADWVRQRYTLAGAPFRVVSIDGTDVNEPGLLTETHIDLTTGGRADLMFTMPEQPVFLAVGGKNLGILISSSTDTDAKVPDKLPATEAFDPIRYGKPASVPFNADSAFDREFTMLLDNKLGFYNGTFNQLYTINGKVFPDTPMFMVREGDLVKTTIVNRGVVDHPMHLHGHHVLVLSRNGEASDGSPWWSDTLDVLPGDTYEIAFRADNPGLWMDHCHNLSHAASGMSMHLMYEGVTSPFEAGADTANHPE